jgi:uncharacterized protein (TIGR00255 family)
MSLASMTGFARREGARGEWTWAVEARSVNGRNLEIRFKGPAGLESLERLARDAAQARFTRGQINVGVQARRSSPSRTTRVNAEALERYLAICEGFAAAGRALTPRLENLLALPGVVEFVEEEAGDEDRAALEADIAAGLAGALDDLKGARRAEGEALAGVLTGLLDRIEALDGDAEREAANQPALIKARLERRVAELLSEAADPGRLAQEVAMLATKADVREEIDRLASHVAAARALLSEGAASGRRLDFLTQEFMREANTLCAKSAATALTAVGLDLKAVIDQLREQVQNVE